MVGRDVVGHVVEDQPEAARGELARAPRPAPPGRRSARRRRSRARSRASRSRPPARRSGSAARLPAVRPGSASAIAQPGRAALPDAHQPDGVDRQRRERVPRRRRAPRRARAVARLAAEPLEPDRGVDLVDRRAGAAGASPASARRPASRRLRAQRPASRNSSATVPVQPVWWLAPMPAPLSPWKYSWNSSRSCQCGSVWNFSMPAEHRAAAVARPSVNVARQPAGDLRRDLEQVQLAPGAGRALDLEPVAVVAVQLEQAAQDDEVHREPHRAAPVRVAAEHAGVGLGRQVADLVAAGRPSRTRTAASRWRREIARMPCGPRNSSSSSMTARIRRSRASSTSDSIAPALGARPGQVGERRHGVGEVLDELLRALHELRVARRSRRRRTRSPRTAAAGRRASAP